MAHSQHDSSDENGVDPEKENQSPTKPVTIWSPTLSSLRKQMFKSYVGLTLLLFVYLLCALSLYWAVLYKSGEKIAALRIYVVDFDAKTAPYTSTTALVGPFVVNALTERAQSSAPHLGYSVIPPAEFNNEPLMVRQAVFDFHAWAAVIIQPNATALLRAAVERGNTSYDPLGACEVVYVQARDQLTIDDYIIPELNAVTTEITSAFGRMWTRMALRNDSIPISNLQAVPQALSPAIGFSQINLRPFAPADVVPAVTVGLIYLIIASFASFPIFMPLYLKLLGPDARPRIPIYQFIAIRWIGAHIVYFFLSLSYSLISLAFQIPFANPQASSTSSAMNPNAAGKATFFVYWMLNWFGMSAFGLATENVSMVVGPRWTSLWLIFWVITNVSTSFYPIDLASRFYNWGYAWPMKQVVDASRSLLFDLHSRLGLNFGILCAWIAINTALYPIACMIAAKKAQREKSH